MNSDRYDFQVPTYIIDILLNIAVLTIFQKKNYNQLCTYQRNLKKNKILSTHRLNYGLLHHVDYHTYGNYFRKPKEWV